MSKVRNLPELLSISDSDLIYAVESATNPNGGRKATIATLRSAILTAAAVKAAYESNANTNAFTDAEKAKLATVQANAAFQNAAQVPYDNSASGLSALQVNAAIDEVNVHAQADFRPSISSGRILHYTGGTVRFDGVFYQLVANDILLNQNITNGEVYVDLDGVVKQTGSGVLAPPYTVVFAKFSTDLNNIISLTDERVKNAQNIIRGILSDVRDVRAGAAASEGNSGRVSDAMHKHNILTAPAVDTGDANTEGSSISLARADHKHNVPVADGIQNLAGIISPLYGSIANTIVQGNDPRLFTQNVVKVKLNPGAGEFSSVAAAMASITTASGSNPFIIEVGPGLYSEPQIVMKPYVSIIGSALLNTILIASDPTNHFIVGSNGVLKNLLITGVTTTNKAGIHFQDVVGGSLVIISCVIQSCNVGLDVVSTTTATTTLIYDTLIVGNTSIGISTNASGGFTAQAFMQNTTISSSNAFGVSVFATGLGSTIFGSGVIFQGVNSGTDKGFSIQDGANIKFVGGQIVKFGNGLIVNNVGIAPNITFASTAFDLNTSDIAVNHPGTLGSLTCVADSSKTTINTSAPIKISLTDPDPTDTTGMFIKGDIFQADRFDRKANLSKIARKATTLGAVQDTNLIYITSVSGLTINVAAGSGFLNDPVDIYLKEVFWSSTNILLTANSNNYIYVDTNSVIQVGSSLPSLETVIPLGRVVTNATGIRFIEDSDLCMNHYGNKTEYLLRYGFGPLFGSGCLVAENATPLKLDVTAGQYTFGVTPFSVSGGTAITWESIYKNGSGGFTNITGQTFISNTQYDNGSGTLASIPSGQFANHTLYVVGDGGNEKWFLVYSQAVAATKAEAEQIPLPVVPSYISEAVVRIASIIVQEGDPNISEILDIRPRLGFAAPSQAVVTIHSELSGLTADDHLQYLNRSGVRPMTGDFDMGSHNITNVGLVDGVDVSAHASRHLPNGADSIATAAATGLDANSTNTEGTANTLARADHTHDLATGAPSTQTPDQANAEGTSANLARADHIHNIPAAAPITNLSPASTNAEGTGSSFARNDHTHALDMAQAGDLSTVNAGDAENLGSVNRLVKADHQHPVATAAAIGLNANSTNTEGSSISLARADHTHDLSTGSPSTQTPDQANAEGTSVNLARADHIHNIPADAPTTTLSPATSNAEGTGSSFARNDHTHAVATALVGNITTIQPDDAAAAGTSDTFARGDHKHAIVASAPTTTLSPATTNAEGSGTAFARNDHTHAVATALVGDITTIQPDDAAAAGTANTFARGDHKHAIVAAAPVDTGTTNSEGSSTSFARADHVHNTIIANSVTSATADDTTLSATDVLIVSMTLTPAAGTYLVTFSSSVLNSANGISRLFVSIYSAGIQIAHSERNVGISGGANVPVHSNAVVTVNGSQAIEARWRAVAGTNTAHQRSLTLIRLG